MRRCSGFTLLELLIATTIAATLGLALYGSIGTAFRARKVIDRQITAMRETSIILDLIERDFQSLLRPNGTLSGPFLGYAMGTGGAEADSVQFYAIDRDASREEPLSEGIKQIQLVLQNDNGGNLLIRKVQRNLLSTSAQTTVDETLSKKVTAFSVKYYDGSSWYEEWDSTMHDNTLPIAVQISITLKRSEDPAATDAYSMSRIIPLACGDNVNYSTTTGGGT